MNKLAQKMVAGGYLTPEKVQEIEKRAERMVDELAKNPKLLASALMKVAGPVPGMAAEGPGFFGKIYESMRARAPDMLGIAAVSAISGGLGSMAESAFRHTRDRVMKSRNYNQMMEANPHLADMDATQVQRAFNTLQRLNPHYAADPMVAGEFVKQTLGQESLNLAGLGNIVKARKDLSDSGRGGSTFGPEFFAKAMPSRPLDPRESEWAAAKERREAERFGWEEKDRPIELQRAADEEARRATEHGRRGVEHGWKGEEHEQKKELFPFERERAPYDVDIAREKSYQEPYRTKAAPFLPEEAEAKANRAHQEFLRAQQELSTAEEGFRAEEAKRKFWEGAEAVSPDDPRVQK
jgi:hypothetical protein